MTAKLTRVTAAFSKWAEREGLFQDSESALYEFNFLWEKEIHNFKPMDDAFDRAVAYCESYKRIGPAPTKEEMRVWLEKRHYELIRSLPDFILKKKSLGIVRHSINSKTELRALQDAVRIVKEREDDN